MVVLGDEILIVDEHTGRTLAGRRYVGLNGGPNFPQTEAVSFMIMTDDQVETDRLWEQVKPLYEELYCYAGDKLKAKYGSRYDDSNVMLSATHTHVASGPRGAQLARKLDLPLELDSAPGEGTRIGCPVTYVWSTEDVALTRAGAELAGEYVDGPYRFVVLDGVSHWIPDERPEQLAAEIVGTAALA